MPYPLPPVINGALVGCTPPPTFCFPFGVTAVTCTATNACGTNTCSFKISVRKVPPPTITCPSNIVATVTCSSNCVPVSYTPSVVNGTRVRLSITPAGRTAVTETGESLRAVLDDVVGRCSDPARVFAALEDVRSALDSLWAERLAERGWSAPAKGVNA